MGLEDPDNEVMIGDEYQVSALPLPHAKLYIPSQGETQKNTNLPTFEAKQQWDNTRLTDQEGKQPPPTLTSPNHCPDLVNEYIRQAMNLWPINYAYDEELALGLLFLRDYNTNVAIIDIHEKHRDFKQMYRKTTLMKKKYPKKE